MIVYEKSTKVYPDWFEPKVSIPIESIKSVYMTEGLTSTFVDFYSIKVIKKKHHDEPESVFITISKRKAEDVLFAIEKMLKENKGRITKTMLADRT